VVSVVRWWRRRREELNCLDSSNDVGTVWDSRLV
jgi:hypothetical protein